MKLKTRNVLVILGALVTLTLGVVAFGAYRIYSRFTDIGVRDEASLPDELREPRVLKGEDLLTKKEIFKLKQNGYWTTIIKSWSISDAKERQKIVNAEVAKYYWGFSDATFFNDSIVTVGEFGAYVFDRDGNLKREILFEPSIEKTKIGGFVTENYVVNADETQIVKLAPERIGFLSQSRATRGVTVYDDQGKIVWQYGEEVIDADKILKETSEEFKKKIRVAGASAGDLDGDGNAEYLVSRYNDGIRAFDQNGRELWFQPEKEPKRDLRIADLDGDDKNEILEIGRNSRVRNTKGEIVRNLGNAEYPACLMIAAAENNKKVLQFFNLSANEFTIGDETGNIFVKMDAPLSTVKLKTPETEYDPAYEGGAYTRDSESVYQPKAVWVALQKDKPKYLAVLAPFGRDISRSVFYLYHPSGDLVYQELLPETAETIAAVPAANATEEIIIGARQTIWKYAAR